VAITKWLVNAPNGKRVFLAVPGGGDVYFDHGSVILDQKLAKGFPKIFIPFEVEDTVVKEKKPMKTLLTEPAPVHEPVIKETPVLSLETEILTEPAPVEKVTTTIKSESKTSTKKSLRKTKSSKKSTFVVDVDKTDQLLEEDE